MTFDHFKFEFVSQHRFQIETKLWRTQTCCGCVNLRVGMLSILFLWSTQTALLLYTSIGKVRWFDFVPSVIHGICVGVAMAFAVFSERYKMQKAFSAISAFLWMGGSVSYQLLLLTSDDRSIFKQFFIRYRLRT